MSMLDLFRLDAEGQIHILNSSLLTLERDPSSALDLEACMRAAHSLKGAARIVRLTAAVDVAHAMEDCFVAAQQGRIVLRPEEIEHLLRGADVLERISRAPTADAAEGPIVAALILAVGTKEVPPASVRSPEPRPTRLSPITTDAVELPASPPDEDVAVGPQPDTSSPKAATDPVLRVTAENVNRLLGLAGESLVESRWLEPFSHSLRRLKRLQHGAGKALDTLRETLSEQVQDDRALALIGAAQRSIVECQHVLQERLTQLELFESRSSNLAHRLYGEALACRMSPFAGSVRNFPRVARDLGRTLCKQVSLKIIGEATQVDRDILERLDAPLGHLVRNAIDHGLERPDERRAAGKPMIGVIQLEARHSAGALQVIVADDGRGIDVEKLRATIIRRNLATAQMAQRMSEAELLEFLFLPGFTLKDEVTELSGRGVGLDVVHNMVKEVRGVVRVTTQVGKGTRFQLQLPLTLSVARTLLVDVGGEPYAFKLAHIVRTLRLKRARIELLEGRQVFRHSDELISLVSARQMLGDDSAQPQGDELAVIVIGEPGNCFGLVVDRFLGESELVVHALDPRLGKIQDISAGALMENGSPVLIVDVEDLVRSIAKLIASQRLTRLNPDAAVAATVKNKRVLIVDDSLTVRELERKLLDQRGYEVEVAVDGMDGWNAVRTGQFNLVVTDVDMPRMDGIELVSLIKKDPLLKSLPVMIVSYKDLEEDRRRGLESGADCYLTKASFHDETLVQAVVDLIGEAAPEKAA
jgi:two-component system, chemotaxis family, sensor histidine kinase and response regulator WspE